MLDTKVWIDLKEDQDFNSEFRQLFEEKNLTIVFSHGNFLDLVRRDEQDELAPIIDGFVGEYLGPLRIDVPETYSYSKDDPLILASIDDQWYQHCKRQTQGLSNVDKLRFLFQDGDFSSDPATSAMSEMIDDLRGLEELNADDRMDIPSEVNQTEAIKKAGLFIDYVKQHPNGRSMLDDRDVPLKRYVFGMSMIYISETYHDPESGDYRDAMIWTQAIVSECRILWTEVQWTYEHPVIQEVMNRLERSPLEIVADFGKFRDVV